jgi:hypothetical protein
MVSMLELGEIDLRVELGDEASCDDNGLLVARSHVVLARAVAGMKRPVGPASADFWRPGRLRGSTLALRRLGHRNRACICEAQAMVINEVFTVTRADIERALAAWLTGSKKVWPRVRWSYGMRVGRWSTRPSFVSRGVLEERLTKPVAPEERRCCWQGSRLAHL